MVSLLRSYSGLLPLVAFAAVLCSLLFFLSFFHITRKAFSVTWRLKNCLMEALYIFQQMSAFVFHTHKCALWSSRDFLSLLFFFCGAPWNCVSGQSDMVHISFALFLTDTHLVFSGRGKEGLLLSWGCIWIKTLCFSRQWSLRGCSYPLYIEYLNSLNRLYGHILLRGILTFIFSAWKVSSPHSNLHVCRAALVIFNSWVSFYRCVWLFSTSLLGHKFS